MASKLDEKRIGTEARIYCIGCHGVRPHMVRAAYSHTDYHEEDDGIWLRSEYDTLECNGCYRITLRTTTYFSEDFDSTGNVNLLPPRSEFTRDPKQFANLPERLRRMYLETIDTFNSGMYTLCAAGLRALVDGMCAALKVKSGMVPKRNSQTGEVIKDAAGNVELRKDKNLEGKIEGLAEQGHLTKLHAKAMHQFRFLGNVAVHELQTPTVGNLQTAINIIEHTLTQVFDLAKDAPNITRKSRRRR